MNITRTGSREEWLAARLDLLAKEKAASRQLAALAEARRALPAVAIDKDFGFEGPDGKVGWIDLFEGRSQLIVYHFMWLRTSTSARRELRFNALWRACCDRGFVGSR